jgi:hypothetical protein
MTSTPQTPTLPTFVHNVIDHHGQPVELYVASLPLSSPAARPTLKIYISPVYDTKRKLVYAHKIQGRGPESEARGGPAWEDEVKEKLKRSKKF